jgi:hypothetical protein
MTELAMHFLCFFIAPGMVGIVIFFAWGMAQLIYWIERRYNIK